MKTCKEFRLEAKQALSGHWALAIGISVVYYLIVYAINALPGAGFIASLIIGGAITCGYRWCWMQLYRTGNLCFNDLFEGFRTPDFGATIGMYVKTVIFTFLWSLLFVIPGIVKAYSYAMAPYILMDNPDMTGGDAIRASMDLMQGRKGKLFLLDLSYIGWHLLSILTLGILELWITPWREAAFANFYFSITASETALPEY